MPKKVKKNIPKKKVLPKKKTPVKANLLKKVVKPVVKPVIKPIIKKPIVPTVPKIEEPLPVIDLPPPAPAVDPMSVS